MLIWNETLNYWVNTATECMFFEVLKQQLWSGQNSCLYLELRIKLAKIYEN